MLAGGFCVLDTHSGGEIGLDARSGYPARTGSEYLYSANRTGLPAAYMHER